MCSPTFSTSVALSFLMLSVLLLAQSLLAEELSSAVLLEQVCHPGVLFVVLHLVILHLNIPQGSSHCIYNSGLLSRSVLLDLHWGYVLKNPS